MKKAPAPTKVLGAADQQVGHHNFIDHDASRAIKLPFTKMDLLDARELIRSNPGHLSFDVCLYNKDRIEFWSETLPRAVRRHLQVARVDVPLGWRVGYRADAPLYLLRGWDDATDLLRLLAGERA